MKVQIEASDEMMGILKERAMAEGCELADALEHGVYTICTAPSHAWKRARLNGQARRDGRKAAG